MAPSSDAPGGTPAEQHASPEELAAYVLEPSWLDAALLEHLATCTFCQTEAGWMQGVVQELEQAPRCPSPDTLVSYALGEASPAEQREIVAHLPGCAACREEVEIANATLKPAVGTLRGFIPIHRRAASFASPRFAAERGSGAVTVDAVAGTTFKVTLEVDPVGTAYVISGLIEQSAPASQAAGPRTAMLYAEADPSLLAAPALVAEELVSEGGEFDLEGIPAGSYRLDIRLSDQVITLQPIPVPWTIPSDTA
jgi:hypothetical protein